MRNKIAVGVMIVGAVGLAIILNMIAMRHDADVMTSGDRYAECIQENFRMTPAEYYQENGEYPDCY